VKSGERRAAGREEKLVGLVEWQRRRLASRLRALREASQVGGPEVRDPEEHMADDLFVDLDVALLQMTAASLESALDARRRLAEGTYGLCADCGEPIAPARLEALPSATRCLRCQEASEARAALAAIARDESASA